MRTYDFAPLTRSSIGFDRLFDLINSNAQQLPTQEPGFPPYDITRTGDDSYRITLAIAGFSPDEIAITAQQNLLTVAGNKPDDGKQEWGGQAPQDGLDGHAHLTSQKLGLYP